MTGGLAGSTVMDTKAPMMMGTIHADGFGGDDHRALTRYYARLSNTKIGS